MLQPVVQEDDWQYVVPEIVGQVLAGGTCTVSGADVDVAVHEEAVAVNI